MKKISALVAIMLLSQSALAVTVSECSSVVKSKARLACYDRLANPSKGSEFQVVPKPEKPVLTDSANPFSAEEARTNARLKGICRGC
ncbi:MAG: hypothetical protein JWO45_746 [Spartobacteria bacterium]|nr:hypothetical protein [Spartobacteria bacterium]